MDIRFLLLLPIRCRIFKFFFSFWLVFTRAMVHILLFVCGLLWLILQHLSVYYFSLFLLLIWFTIFFFCRCFSFGSTLFFYLPIEFNKFHAVLLASRSMIHNFFFSLHRKQFSLAADVAVANKNGMELKEKQETRWMQNEIEWFKKKLFFFRFVSFRCIITKS